MRRVVYTKEDEDQRIQFLLDNTKYCVICGNILCGRSKKFCDGVCKNIHYKIEPPEYGSLHDCDDPIIRRKRLDYWNKRNKYRNMVFNQAVRVFPHLALKFKPENISNGAWRYRVFKQVLELSPTLRRNF